MSNIHPNNQSKIQPNNQTNKSNRRLAVAAALFCTSILASLLISFLSQSGAHYWVYRYPISRGVQIEASDITLSKVSLGQDLRGYLTADQSPIGSITRRNINGGELINVNDLSDDSGQLTSESLSFSIRAADISPAIAPGSIVSLYQVHDARNGEVVPEPLPVLAGVFVKDVSRKSANFGSDLTLTVTIDREDVISLLSATSSGRIVVVSSHG